MASQIPTAIATMFDGPAETYQERLAALGIDEPDSRQKLAAAGITTVGALQGLDDEALLGLGIDARRLRVRGNATADLLFSWGVSLEGVEAAVRHEMGAAEIQAMAVASQPIQLKAAGLKYGDVMACIKAAARSPAPLPHGVAPEKIDPAAAQEVVAATLTAGDTGPPVNPATSTPAIPPATESAEGPPALTPDSGTQQVAASSIASASVKARPPLRACRLRTGAAVSAYPKADAFGGSKYEVSHIVGKGAYGVVW